MQHESPMTGFPPEPSGQVTLANWRTPPFNRWAFQHVREIVPSAEIANDPDRVWTLPQSPRDLSALRIGEGDLAAFLEGTDTDAMVVIHRGRIVFEHYAHGMTPGTPHILMSVSKSMLGLVAAMLAARGTLDIEAPVTAYVPELAGTAYRDARVAHLLDMRAGILFDEDYLAASGPIVQYRKAQGWNPLDPGETPSDLRSFFSTLVGSDGPHRGRFHYVSPNTDLLAGHRRGASCLYHRRSLRGAPLCGRVLRDGARSGPRRLAARAGWPARWPCRRAEGVDRRRHRQWRRTGLGVRRLRALFSGRDDALPQQMVCAERRWRAAPFRARRQRPEPVRRPRQRHRDRQVLVAGGSHGFQTDRADDARDLGAALASGRAVSRVAAGPRWPTSQA
jgi:hypothetical protein